MTQNLLLLLALALGLSACRPAPPQPVAYLPTATSVPTPAPGEPIAEEEARHILNNLTLGLEANARQAVEAILAAHDTRFIAPLIEMLFAGQIELAQGPGLETTVAALETLSGQTFGNDWPAWVEWYAQTGLTPPPGFTTWKGRLYGRLDPTFAQFLQDGLPAAIRPEEIQWGGVPFDGIPALDRPAMIPPAAATYLEPGDPVFGLAFNGESRAYPLRILDWHEMVNDVVGSVPVSLAYCTLCGAGIAYAGRASGDTLYTFGSSGLLYRSNKLMYDRETHTLWNQFTGEPALGPLANTGIHLQQLPLVLTTWQDWQTAHPETLVLDPQTGFDRPYIPGAAYGDYFAYAGTMFPVAPRSDRFPAKTRVYTLLLDGAPKAYPLESLATAIVVNDVVGESPVMLIAPHGQITVEGTSRRAGPVTYNAGGEVRAYQRGNETFSPGPDAFTVLDSAGQPWQVTEEALLGPGGASLPRVPGHLAYWFAWYAFFPGTQVYTP